MSVCCRPPQAPPLTPPTQPVRESWDEDASPAQAQPKAFLGRMSTRCQVVRRSD